MTVSLPMLLFQVSLEQDWSGKDHSHFLYGLSIYVTLEFFIIHL